MVMMPVTAVTKPTVTTMTSVMRPAMPPVDSRGGRGARPSACAASAANDASACSSASPSKVAYMAQQMIPPTTVSSRLRVSGRPASRLPPRIELTAMAWNASSHEATKRGCSARRSRVMRSRSPAPPASTARTGAKARRSATVWVSGKTRIAASATTTHARISAGVKSPPRKMKATEPANETAIVSRRRRAKRAAMRRYPSMEWLSAAQRSKLTLPASSMLRNESKLSTSPSRLRRLRTDRRCAPERSLPA